MKAALVSLSFAAAASAVALPGAGGPGGCCFQYDGLKGKQFGSFYYNEAAGVVTNQWGNGCGWGQDGNKFVCGDNAMDSQSWTSTGSGLISWSGHEDYFYACYGGEAVNDAEIYLQPPKEKKCEKIYAKKQPCPKPPPPPKPCNKCPPPPPPQQCCDKPSATTSSATTSSATTSTATTSSVTTSSATTSSATTSSTQPSASPFDYASAIDCDGKDTQCRTALNANQATCSAYYAACEACLDADATCRVGPNANQASCSASVVSCVAAAYPNLV